jgi:uncharacterized lipoprotein NlpE involved in copper resistance
MRKIFLTAGFALSLFIMVSCHDSPKTKPIITEKASTVDSTISDGHNSSNSLDVDGEYKGTLPCADCEGIDTKIILAKDQAYVKQIKYLGKDGKVFEEKGFYTWNSDGNTITLTGVKNAPNQYFVGENKLIQLDMDGNRIIGNLSDKYVLHK